MRWKEEITGFLRSCKCAARGISFAAWSQRNFRIHLIAAVVMLAAGVLLGFTRLEMALLLLTIILVILGELFNTALELTLNLIESRNHPAVGAAKDIAAGAVFATSLGAVGMGILLFGPYLLRFVRRL